MIQERLIQKRHGTETINVSASAYVVADQMIINVRFVASIKEKTGCPEIILEVDKGSSVRFLIDYIKEEYPKLSGHDDFVFSVNRRQVSEDLILRDGDELSIMPPAHYY